MRPLVLRCPSSASSKARRTAGCTAGCAAGCAAACTAGCKATQNSTQTGKNCKSGPGLGQWRKQSEKLQRKAIFSACERFHGIREGCHFGDDEFTHEKEQGLLANKWKDSPLQNSTCFGSDAPAHIHSVQHARRGTMPVPPLPNMLPACLLHRFRKNDLAHSAT